MKTFKSLTEAKGPYNNEIIKTAIHHTKEAQVRIGKVDGDTGKANKLAKDLEKELNKILKEEQGKM